MKILSFGSLNIDYVYRVPHFVEGGETLASTSLALYCGGKGLNQSIALAKAGMEVYHAGAIGEDGQFLLEELKKAGVDTKEVRILPDVKTGHAIIQTNPAGNNCILLYGGANQRITKEQIDDTLQSFQPGDALVIQNEINELLYLVKQAKCKKDMIVILNPSPMAESLWSLLPFVDYLILNEVEAGQFLNGHGHDGQAATTYSLEDPEGMAKALYEKLASMKTETAAVSSSSSSPKIILTLGEKGSMYTDGTVVLRQPAKKVDVMDTTAAGDTYTGYFFAGLFLKRKEKEATGGELDPAWAMAYATQASAMAVTRAGAAPSIPTKAEVLAALEPK